MNEIIKKMNEALTKIDGMDKITMTDDNLLAVHMAAMEGYTEVEAAEILKKNKSFTAAHDKHVAEILVGKDKDFNDKLSAKNTELESLKNTIPRPDSPEEIKKRLDIEKDTTERRILNIELQAATDRVEREKISNQLTEEKNSAEILRQKTVLDALAKENKYLIPDTSVFLAFGENASDKMKEFAEANNKILEDRVTEIAAKKFGGQIIKGDTIAAGSKSLDDIEKIEDPKARMEALVTAGYVAE